MRVFDQPFLYEAEDEEGEKCRIIVTRLTSGIYAKTLHAMTNASEIKKFYEKNGEVYRYYNIIILENEGLIEKIKEHLAKKNARRHFNKKGIKLAICLLQNGSLSLVDIFL